MTELSPPARVVAAMPGTLRELSARTGYSIEQVLKQIRNARREGKRVLSTEDGVSRNVTKRIDPDNPVETTTVFMLDMPTQHEVE